MQNQTQFNGSCLVCDERTKHCCCEKQNVPEAGRELRPDLILENSRSLMAHKQFVRQMRRLRALQKRQRG